MIKILTALLLITTFSPATQIPETIVLPDFPRITYELDTTSRTTVVHILFSGGQRAVPDTLGGLAYLTTRLGIQLRDAVSIRSAVEMGSQSYFQVDRDYILISIKCLSRYLRDTLDLVGDNLVNPLFTSVRINRIKEHMKHLQKAEEDNDIRFMHRSIRSIFYKNRKTGASIYGDKASIDRLSKRDAREFFRRIFHSGNMTISVSSDIEQESLGKIFFDVFPPFEKRAGFSLKPYIISLPEKRDYFFKRDRRQTLVAIALPLPPISRETFAASFLLENLLGKGTGSRMWRLRDEQQLAYLMDAVMVHQSGNGILTLFMKTGHDKRKRAMESLGTTLDALASGDLSRTEFAMHRAHAGADFHRNHETKERRALNRAYFDLMGLGAAYPDTFDRYLDALTYEDFLRFIRRVLDPDQRVRVVIGPQSI